MLIKTQASLSNRRLRSNTPKRPLERIMANKEGKKFRWSACFAFISKAKPLKRKSSKPPNPSSHSSHSVQSVALIGTKVTTLLTPQRFSLPPTPISALSPPPRHNHFKRRDRTAAPSPQPSQPKPIPVNGLRLSLNAELDHEDARSDYRHSAPISTKSDSSNTPKTLSRISTTPSQFSDNPFSSNTLGLKSNSRRKDPQLPDSTISTIESHGHGLPLKERRRRRSPLMIPDDERLTLKSLDSNLTVKQTTKHMEKDDLAWRQQILHQSLKYCFDKIHRKPSVSKPVIPIAPLDNLDHIRVPLSASSSYTQGGSDIGRDKAQYEAVVAQTMHRRPKGHDGRRRIRSNSTPAVDPLAAKDDQTKASLQIIREHRPSRSQSPPVTMAMIPQSARTPSLIYGPSSPSSIDTVNDYLDGKQDTLLPFADNS
ncbi:hypothetical protein CLU79DRAFT_759378 [Phycomyces nitens]|nr:hypothetical protein CLU79DRAFT_759378 [Phycomyces nitens]